VREGRKGLLGGGVGEEVGSEFVQFLSSRAADHGVWVMQGGSQRWEAGVGSDMVGHFAEFKDNKDAAGLIRIGEGGGHVRKGGRTHVADCYDTPVHSFVVGLTLHQGHQVGDRRYGIGTQGVKCEHGGLCCLVARAINNKADRCGVLDEIGQFSVGGSLPRGWLLLDPFQQKWNGVCADGANGLPCVGVLGRVLVPDVFVVRVDPVGKGSAVVAWLVRVGQKYDQGDSQPTAGRDDEERSPFSHVDTLQRKEGLERAS